MSNSKHSVTTDTQTGSTTLTLHLHGYLTPSLNTILSNHWSHLHKHKQKARDALLSSLSELALNSKTSTISSAEPNHLPINYDTLDSFLMTIPNQSQRTTNNKSVSTKETRKPSSKSSIIHSNHPPANPHKHYTNTTAK